MARVDNPEYMDQQAQEFFKELGISKLIYPEMLAAVDINNGLKMSWVRQRWDVHDGALVMLGIKRGLYSNGAAWAPHRTPPPPPACRIR